MLHRFLLALALLAVVACSPTVNPAPWPVPPAPVPVDPPPVPVPVDPPGPLPPPPTPAPVTNAVPFDVIQRITEGMTRAELVALIGREPDGDRDQGDGTRILRWPAVNAAGAPKYLDVQLEAGKVLGRALVAR